MGPHEVDVWLRQEHLADEERAMRSVGRVNDYRPRLRLRQPSPARYFTREQTETLYARNPRWAEIERRVYG